MKNEEVFKLNKKLKKLERKLGKFKYGGYDKVFSNNKEPIRDNFNDRCSQFVYLLIDLFLSNESLKKNYPLFLREFVIIKLLRSKIFEGWFDENGKSLPDGFSDLYDKLISTLQNNKKLLFSALLENIALKKDMSKENSILKDMLNSSLSDQDKEVLTRIAENFSVFSEKNPTKVSESRRSTILEIFSESKFNPLKIEKEKGVQININKPENRAPVNFPIKPDPQPKNENVVAENPPKTNNRQMSFFTKILIGGSLVGALGVFGYFIAKRYGYIKK